MATDERPSLRGVSPDYNSYFLALGLFTQAFTDMETLVALLLRIQTGVSQETARAVFSGVRIDQAKGFITRTREAYGVGEHPDLKRAFDQIGVITGVRNDIVHFGSRYDGEGGFSVSNVLIAVSPARERSYPVSDAILYELIADPNTIRQTLAAYIIELLVWSPEATHFGSTPPIE
jgi:hypothetical protein